MDVKKFIRFNSNVEMIHIYIKSLWVQKLGGEIKVYCWIVRKYLLMMLLTENKLNQLWNLQPKLLLMKKIQDM